MHLCIRTGIYALLVVPISSSHRSRYLRYRNISLEQAYFLCKRFFNKTTEQHFFQMLCNDTNHRDMTKATSARNSDLRSDLPLPSRPFANTV
ncbi:hypothetical protein POVWA2_060060 [Plasmodium ovale wallikeri]|uniref:Uncharacterized protein n=1 Tax=Plasmodium ovale wallikeri TaxID=864142 RepID=A0A1A9A2H1_PLAOA|nr:hypothetical protein POVWA1_060720 [Plasmodium ovale wallikeri]SBT50390.1 hypothetical protein POVWA2_060060 [Plasmodium ovale wallikeri]